MDATDLQKKLTEMVKTAKAEQTRWKEERSVAQPPPPPFFHAEMEQRGIKTTVSGNVAFRGRFQSLLQDEYRYSTRAPPQQLMDRSCKGENCSTCAKCVRCLGSCLGGRWEKDFGRCSRCIHCTKCVASGNDEDWETFQSRALTVEDIPRAREIEDIKELPAPELTQHQPRNQCPWCGLALQRSTSVHRKFCMNMPMCMWLARQRATSRACNVVGEGRPSVVQYTLRRTREHIPTTWADTGLSEETRLKYAAKYPALCRP